MDQLTTILERIRKTGLPLTTKEGANITFPGIQVVRHYTADLVPVNYAKITCDGRVAVETRTPRGELLVQMFRELDNLEVLSFRMPVIATQRPVMFWERIVGPANRWVEEQRKKFPFLWER